MLNVYLTPVALCGSPIIDVHVIGSTLGKTRPILTFLQVFGARRYGGYMPASKKPTKPTLLVLEDGRMTGRALERTFKSKGYDVTWIQSSAIALELLRQETFNVIVTDLMMTELQGAELIRELVREAKGTPIIVFSGYLDIATTVQCMRAGAFNVIEKSEETEKIIEAVREAASAERHIHPRTDTPSELKLDAKTLYWKHLERAKTLWNLDATESDVLGGIIADKTAKELAAELHCSTRRVEGVIQNLFIKASARSRTELINKFWVALRD